MATDEWRQALDQVLNSQTFCRSDQLRGFLEYVCAKVIAGQAADIKEYVIGVEVFRRPRDYSPATDSCVRSRAWELRQKLEEYYAREAPDAQWRIVLPKGSYVPQFVKMEGAPPDAATTARLPPSSRSWKLASAFLLGFLLCGALAVAWRLAAPPGRPPSVLREAWGPLAGHNANVLVGVASALHMSVRPHPFNETPSRPALPVPPAVYELLRQYRQPPSSPQLYFRPSDSLVQISVVSGIVTAANTLQSLGATFQILPERAAPLAALRGRNVVLFGDPAYSNAVDHEMKRAYWTTGYDPRERLMVIRDRRLPDSAPPLFSRGQRSAAGPASAYGLITVLPGEGDAGEKRIVVVSGISSVGIHGAMEFFSSPGSLAKLRSRFRSEGFSGFPPAYQVAVRCTSDDTLLLSAEYAAHVVIGAGKPR